jgi:hypothetical protein
MNIPTFDFRGNKFVNEDGKLSDVAQAFMDELINALIAGAGQEGLVSPTQNAANIVTIQNNQTTGPTGIISPTCDFGTSLYNSDANSIMFTINDGSGNPIFKTVTLT